MHEIDVSQQQLLHAAREREADLPGRRERRAEVLLGGATVLCMAVLWLFPLSGGGSWLGGAAGVPAVGVTKRGGFDVGGGFTVPLQLAFVPPAVRRACASHPARGRRCDGRGASA